MCRVDECTDWVGVHFQRACVYVCVQRVPEGEECPCLTKQEVLKRESAKKIAAPAPRSFPGIFKT